MLHQNASNFSSMHNRDFEIRTKVVIKFITITTYMPRDELYNAQCTIWLIQIKNKILSLCKIIIIVITK